MPQKLEAAREDHLFSTYEKFSVKLTLLPPDTNINVCISVVKKFFGKLCVRTDKWFPRCFAKKWFLEILQNSQEKTCAGVSQKKSTARFLSCEFSKILKNILFIEYLRTAPSGKCYEQHFLRHNFFCFIDNGVCHILALSSSLCSF